MTLEKQSDRGRVIFVITILVGSFLLFLVQPMVARMALPRLGGAPNVWNSALLVYQALLLGGYAYAHFIGRMLPRHQFALHIALLALAGLTLPIALADVRSLGQGWEVLWVPLLLLASVGPVFFLVSAQAPLVQRWYALDESAGDPYPLYAASNFGSFAGLISYPLLFEPFVPLRQQAVLWSAIYVVLIVLVCLLMRSRSRLPHLAKQTAPSTANAGTPIGPERVGMWLLLAAVPSGLMLSTTTHLTTDIFAMPLLWVIPLGLYLLSFTAAFAERRATARVFTRTAPLIIVLAGAMAMTGKAGSGLLVVFTSLLMLFSISVALHGRLYDLRPDPSRLTFFYLIMSAGGALGGLFTALIAPLIFDWVWEHPLLVLMAAALLPLGGLSDWQQRIAGSEKTRLRALAVGMVIAAAVACGLFYSSINENWLWTTVTLFMLAGLALTMKFSHFAFVVILALIMVGRGALTHLSAYSLGERTRSYFGVYTIADREQDGIRVLTHGTTVHGRQFLGPKDRLEPTTYYGEHSGVGLVLSHADALYGSGARIGIVGLGAGTLACYRQPDQVYRFYEIDPAVLEYSTEGVFTFLEECAPDSQTVIGDARLELEAEPAGQLEILAVDAFSSDAIPLHLLTKEAIETYGRSVGPDGLVAIHISNRFIALEPVLSAFLRDSGWPGVIRIDQGDESRSLTASAWVVISRSEQKIEELLETTGRDEWRALNDNGSAVWTDNFSSAIPHIRWQTMLRGSQ
ncbi:hypothetical protein P7228_06365 [Altererythrobacter arenosus]|uniref:Spermidine synthase n=1 Tax=Altererythrobacter arenosus TaxID=3032592 RepID=A0ABY8FUK1_9SPHN|nr:hypothetical protein [Altererythrobacter sp. CAU 1644]WFL78684.1 hypothetical protein P7228_06365 [Altererythrobacter sp. CAU 1644]